MDEMQEKDELISLSQAALHLEISIYTLNNWYKWYSSDLNKTNLVLPEIVRIGGPRGKRCIRKSEMPLLSEFKKNLKRGDMAEFSAAFLWGRRGEEILERRGALDKETIKSIWRNTKKSI